MFEKEAKERAEEIEANQTLGVYDNDEDLARDEGWNDGYVSGYEEGFQNGAEFGYNKAKEEMQEQGLALQSDMDKTIEQNIALKNLVEKYRQAVDKCLHITFMGGGCEVNTIGQYATLVDGYLTDVEGLAKWKN